MPSLRKSARTKGARASYAEDAIPLDDDSSLEQDGAASEQEALSSASPPKRRPKRVKREEASDDDEYAPGADIAEADDDPDVVDEEDEEDLDVESQDEDAMEIDEPRSKFKRKQPSRTFDPLPDGTMRMHPDETHSRGILDPKNHVSKFMHYMSTFGSDDRDLGPVVHSRGRWRFSRDATFPTRLSLELEKGESDLPLGSTLGVSEEDLEQERTIGWDWYYSENTGARFRDAQRAAKIPEADARRTYLPRVESGAQTVLMGPADSQRKYQLACHDSLNTGEAWGDIKGKASISAKETLHDGWLLRIGHKINSMAWASNQDESFQYLAVASPITDDQKKETFQKEHQGSSFRPSPSYPSTLQIWEFKGKKAGKFTETLDMSSKPRLRLVVCSDWGDLRRMVWCPMDRKRRDQDKSHGQKDIGVLATIWGDGKVRVLDLKIREGPETTEYIKLASPAFEAIPPSTICTCVTWLSPSDIAVGCANGFVAVWNIIPSPTSKPQPYFYHTLHSTYVLNIISIYPTNPHILCTVSMDGETRICSIVDPLGDNSSTVRVRTPSSHITYSPILQSICAGDDNECGRIMPVRRFFGTNATAKVPSSISCLSPCSFWHPSLLSGGNGGEVVASNPLRRLLYTKEKQWQQIWFTHDWVPGKNGKGPGVSRFYDGFQAETQGNARERANEGRPVGYTITTIFDENQHVTTLGWNPNRQCAAWASAALGCGLIRIEDLAA